jgi:hypothetical protein
MPVVRIKRPGYSGVHGADRPGVFGVEDLQWNKRMESTVSALIEWYLCTSVQLHNTCDRSRLRAVK